MTRTIWKFPLETKDQQNVSMPKGAKLLAVQVQNGQPCLWALVNPEWDKIDYDIRIHGTGHELPADVGQYEHAGTFQLSGGALVFHVFRVVSAEELLGRLFSR